MKSLRLILLATCMITVLTVAAEQPDPVISSIQTAYQKAKYKLQHNDSLLIAFHDETHKNDKIRTLA